jgi:tetratricopeptide (TPR) repeat protein
MEMVKQFWRWLLDSSEWLSEKIVAAYYWVLAGYPHLALLGTVLTIIGGLYTLYRIRLGWDSTRRTLFLAYMEAEEKKIDDRKSAVSRRLQDAKRISIVPEDLDVHAIIDKAIVKFDTGDLEEAENVLRDLNGRLAHRISFAEKQMHLAQKQSGAVHLFLGSIAAAAGQAQRAVHEFTKVLEFNKNDADALKYIAEQKLVLADKEQREDVIVVPAQGAHQRAEELLGIAGKNQTLKAEAILLQGRARLKMNRKNDAKDSGREGAAISEKLNEPHLNAQMHEMLGDACSSLGHWGEAEIAYKKSFDEFRNAKDSKRADIADRKLKMANQRDKDVVTLPWPFPARLSRE